MYIHVHTCNSPEMHTIIQQLVLCSEEKEDNCKQPWTHETIPRKTRTTVGNRDYMYVWRILRKKRTTVGNLGHMRLHVCLENPKENERPQNYASNVGHLLEAVGRVAVG